MSKAWHWIMLLMIFFLFGVTMSLLSNSCSSSRSGQSARRGVAKDGSLRHLFGEGSGRGFYYSHNYSSSSRRYHYEQLREGWGGGGGSGSSSRVVENDSLGDNGGSSLTQQQHCNLLQRILDSRIKSIQFLRSHFTRQSCMIKEEEDDYGNLVAVLVLSTLAGDNPHPESAWTLSNGKQNYQVRILTPAFSSHQRRLNSSGGGVADVLGERHNEMWSQSFVVKNQFPIGINRLTRGANEMDDNADYSAANQRDNPIEGAVVIAEQDDNGESLETDEQSPHSMGQPRTFHFLRKLQFFEEEEEKEEEVNDKENDKDEEEEVMASIDIGRGDNKSNKVIIIPGVNPQGSVADNPAGNASITLRGIERFLELVGPPKSPLLLSKREAISPTSRKSSQLFRLEQRLLNRARNWGKGGRGSSRPSAKKCKLNGKSKACRRRKGMRRKAPTSIDNVQPNDKSPSSTRKSSGDKWKFILENFCAKSHLHGQLPKLIAKLEKQQQKQQEATAKKQQHQQQNGQDHGQRTATTNNKDDQRKVQQPIKNQNKNFRDEDESDDIEDDEEEDELSMARTTDSLRLEVIKEQILKKLGLKRAPNITNAWTAAETAALPVDALHNDTTRAGVGAGDDRSRDGRRMVEKKTANFMFGNGPTGIQLPNNNSQFFIHDGHTRPMEQELFLSKELILATLYRAQLDSGGGQSQQSHEGGGGGYANPSSGQATNRLFDDLHAEDGRGRKKRRKGRKRKRKSAHNERGDGWAAFDDDEKAEEELQNDETASSYLESRASEDLKSHTRRYLAEDEFDEEEDAFEERQHRYQWENNQQDDGRAGDEENYGQSREIITFAERGEKTEISSFYFYYHFHNTPPLLRQRMPTTYSHTPTHSVLL